LGSIQLIRHLYTATVQRRSVGIEPQPSTNLVLRRNLISVTSLADTLKTW